jgi:hypothetical protein
MKSDLCAGLATPRESLVSEDGRYGVRESVERPSYATTRRVGM